eukprot:419713-Pleurochrysis_carterae.AAC.1
MRLREHLRHSVAQRRRIGRSIISAAVDIVIAVQVVLLSGDDALMRACRTQYCAGGHARSDAHAAHAAAAAAAAAGGGAQRDK